MAKKYKIIVNGQVESKELVPLDSYEYHILGNDSHRAEEQAKEIFVGKFPNAKKVTTSKKNGNIAAIIFLIIPIMLSFIPFYDESGYNVLNLKPGVLTGTLAFFMYFAIIVRLKGLRNSFNSFSDGLLSILTIWFCATLINFFTGDIVITNPFHINPLTSNIIIKIPGPIILIIGLLVSWLGMKSIAGIIWIIFILISAIQIVQGDAVMGIWGFIYIISGFMGIVFQLKQMNSNFFTDFGKEFTSMGSKTRLRIMGDVGSFTSDAKKVTGNVINSAKKLSSQKKQPIKKTTRKK
ncbi:MAG: hypothetical protein FWD24_02820 [Treponema sp.]|nr:hypothetical protein [Treponema sp.]